MSSFSGASTPRPGVGPDGPAPVPGGVAAATPGPELHSTLSAVDVGEVSGLDTVEVAKAWWRQVSHDKAQFLLAVLETGIRRPGSGDTVSRVAGEPGEFAAEEVRAALVWSRRRAGDTFELAFDVHVRLPMIGAAMLAGDLDEYRAAALAQWTRELAQPDAEYVCDELIDQAAGIMVGALIDRIKRLAIMLDPEWAERRYRAAVRRRRVVGTRSADGTATVSGVDLPVDRAKAGCDRIDTLARSCKTAGDRRPVDHIRADCYLGMIDGTFTGMSDADIVAHVLAYPFVDDDDIDSDAPDRGDPDGHGPDGDSDVPDGGEPGRRGPGGNDPVRDDPDGDDSDGDGPYGDEPGRGDPERDDPDDDGPDGDESDSGKPDGGEPSGGPRPPGKPGGGDCGRQRGWGVRELRVELASAIGCDDHPGEIPPWGYVPAGVARDMITAMGDAEWRFVICDRDGRPICSGITNARPAGVSRSATRSRGASAVELQVRARDLSQLDAECAEFGWHAAWAPVITDIAARVNAGNVDSDAADDEARRRAPGAGLRRLVQVRARYCTHPACAAPAVEGDQDHAVDYAHGGATDAANLHPPCQHDHRLRHDGGWHVAIQPDGATIWTSALGHSYATRPPPVMIDGPKPWDKTIMCDVDDIDEQHRAKPPPAHELAHILDDDPPPF